MNYHLVVTNPFGDYVRGDRIENSSEVNRILASHNEGHVVKVLAPDPEIVLQPVKTIPVLQKQD